MKEHRPCLVLNQDYSPLTVIGWKRAMKLYFSGEDEGIGGVRVIEYYDNEVVTSAGGIEFPLPAVAVSKRYVSRPRIIAIKKKNLMLRDDKTCQYCGERISYKDATVDHIKPQSRFKPVSLAHTWDNITLACFACNFRKGNRTPDQANMPLLSEPYEPDPSKFYSKMSLTDTVPEKWQTYV